MKYFAYGSNLSRIQIKRRCRSANLVSIGILHGYQFLINQRGYATIRKNKRYHVHGAIWDISQSDKRILDMYEGVRSDNYYVDTVTISTERGDIEAITYIDNRCKHDAPNDGYLEKIIYGAYNLGIDHQYITDVLEPWGDRPITNKTVKTKKRKPVSDMVDWSWQPSKRTKIESEFDDDESTHVHDMMCDAITDEDWETVIDLLREHDKREWQYAIDQQLIDQIVPNGITEPASDDYLMYDTWYGDDPIDHNMIQHHDIENYEQYPLFVYGTLKRGFHNHRVMEAAGGHNRVIARTADQYPLVVDGLPYLLNHCGKGHRVFGEVYDINDITPVDRFESHPSFYCRHLVDVQVGDLSGTRTIKAWVYFLNGDHKDHLINQSVSIYTGNKYNTAAR